MTAIIGSFLHIYKVQNQVVFVSECEFSLPVALASALLLCAVVPVLTLSGPRELLLITALVSGEFGRNANFSLAAEVFLLSASTLKIQ